MWKIDMTFSIKNSNANNIFSNVKKRSIFPNKRSRITLVADIVLLRQSCTRFRQSQLGIHSHLYVEN